MTTPPFLQRQATQQLAAIQEAVARVIGSGRFLFGAETRAFEAELAESLESDHAVGVGSGTDALHLALRALDVGPGDEVVTQSHSSPFTFLAIHATGARAVFVDSSEEDFAMDVTRLEAALTNRTKAVLPIHLYGHPGRIQEIVEIASGAGIPVVEDCAQAHGATVQGRPVGTFGAIGCFSFYPTKNLGALGDAGAAVTNDPRLAARLRTLQNGGMVSHGIHSQIGVASRLDELQAAVLRLRLPELAADNEQRRRHARSYAGELLGVRKPAVRDDCQWAPHQYVIRHPGRDALRSAMQRRGYELLVHYARPIHLQTGFEVPEYPKGSLPVAEQLAREVLSLPTHPLMSPDERGSLIENLNQAIREVTTPASGSGHNPSTP